MLPAAQAAADGHGACGGDHAGERVQLPTLYCMSAPHTTAASAPRLRLEHGAKRIRAYLGGELVADTIRPVLVWEIPYYPAYYFPAGDVRGELLEEEEAVKHSPSRGDGQSFTVNAGGKRAIGGALRYPDSPIPELR